MVLFEYFELLVAGDDLDALLDVVLLVLEDVADARGH